MSECLIIIDFIFRVVLGLKHVIKIIFPFICLYHHDTWWCCGSHSIEILGIFIRVFRVCHSFGALVASTFSFLMISSPCCLVCFSNLWTLEYQLFRSVAILATWAIRRITFQLLLPLSCRVTVEFTILSRVAVWLEDSIHVLGANDTLGVNTCHLVFVYWYLLMQSMCATFWRRHHRLYCWQIIVVIHAAY